MKALAGLLATLAVGVFASPAAAAIAPIIVSPQAVPLGGGNVELKAQIYTYGSDSHYHFEYGTTTTYGTDIPTSDANAGTESIVNVAQTVTGLAANTTYHFRIVATNEAGPGSSPDGTFDTSTGAPKGGGGGGETPVPPNGSTVRLKAVTIKGKRILASGKGRTLYSLSAEKKGRFICTEKSSCLTLWKPIMVPAAGSVKAPEGIKLGSVKRPEGGRQTTYHGLPLYTFVEDTKKGEANGEGLKDVGTWHSVKLPPR